MPAIMSKLYQMAAGLLLLQACSAVDIYLYNDGGCPYGDEYFTCSNVDANTCCFRNGQEVILSCARSDNNASIMGYAQQGSSACGASLGLEEECFDYSEDPIMVACMVSSAVGKRAAEQGACKRQEADSVGRMIEGKRYKMPLGSVEHEQLSAIKDDGEKKLFMKRFGTLEA